MHEKIEVCRHIYITRKQIFQTSCFETKTSDPMKISRKVGGRSGGCLDCEFSACHSNAFECVTILTNKTKKTNELYFIPITVHRKLGSSSMGDNIEIGRHDQPTSMTISKLENMITQHE